MIKEKFKIKKIIMNFLIYPIITMLISPLFSIYSYFENIYCNLKTIYHENQKS